MAKRQPKYQLELLGEVIGIDRLPRRRFEYQVSGLSARTVRNRLHLEFVEKSSNPTLQSNRATASRTFGIGEEPSPIQSPNTLDNADRLSCPVYVLPLKTQVLTWAHASCEGNCEHRAVRGGQCNIEQRPRLLKRQSPHFVSWLLRHLDAVCRILKQQAPLQSLAHRRRQHNVRVTDRSRRQATLDHLLMGILEIQRAHRCQNSFAQGRADVSSQHAFVVLARLLSYSGLEPSVKILVERDLCSLQITTQVAFAQLPRKLGLRFPHGAVDRSIVVFAFAGLVITAEMNPN